MRMIALDLGSTFTKAALLTSGMVQAERQIPTPTALLKITSNGGFADKEVLA